MVAILFKKRMNGGTPRNESLLKLSLNVEDFKLRCNKNPTDS